MEKAQHQHYRQHHEVKIGRLEALVDAVFAFAMTLLVLNLVVPRALSAADFDATLLWLTSDILIYFLSFVILGSICGVFIARPQNDIPGPVPQPDNHRDRRSCDGGIGLFAGVERIYIPSYTGTFDVFPG